MTNKEKFLDLEYRCLLYYRANTANFCQVLEIEPHERSIFEELIKFACSQDLRALFESMANSLATIKTKDEYAVKELFDSIGVNVFGSNSEKKAIAYAVYMISVLGIEHLHVHKEMKGV